MIPVIVVSVYLVIIAVIGSVAFRKTQANTEDFFLVLTGILDIELRDQTITLGPGELYIVPKGIEHRPVARHGEVTPLLIEPSDTPNTGDAKTAAARKLA